MAFNQLFGGIAISDVIGIYNTILNSKQIKSDIDNKQLEETILKCTKAIFEKIEKIDNREETKDLLVLEQIVRRFEMKAIQIMLNHMQDTLDEAYDYYRDFIIFKDTFPKTAKTALDMANVHINQLYPKLHDTIVYMINEYKSKGNEIPTTMQEAYDYEHQKLIEDYDELSYKIKNAISNM